MKPIDAKLEALSALEESQMRGPSGLGMTLREAVIFRTLDEVRETSVALDDVESLLVQLCVDAANRAERRARSAKSGDGDSRLREWERGAASAYFDMLKGLDEALTLVIGLRKAKAQ